MHELQIRDKAGGGTAAGLPPALTSPLGARRLYLGTRHGLRCRGPPRARRRMQIFQTTDHNSSVKTIRGGCAQACAQLSRFPLRCHCGPRQLHRHALGPAGPGQPRSAAALLSPGRSFPPAHGGVNLPRGPRHRSSGVGGWEGTPHCRKTKDERKGAAPQASHAVAPSDGRSRPCTRGAPGPTAARGEGTEREPVVPACQLGQGSPTAAQRPNLGRAPAEESDSRDTLGLSEIALISPMQRHLRLQTPRPARCSCNHRHRPREDGCQMTPAAASRAGTDGRERSLGGARRHQIAVFE